MGLRAFIFGYNFNAYKVGRGYKRLTSRALALILESKRKQMIENLFAPYPLFQYLKDKQWPKWTTRSMISDEVLKLPNAFQMKMEEKEK